MMPKEASESSKETQKTDEDGAEETAESSEELMQKRMRRNTPSPHRLSPHSSPLRFISMEERMETDRGVSNMALAHEIMMNSAFQIKPFEPEEGSLAKQVKEIMHKAFWDSLESQLNEEPPSYAHAITLVAEIKETLLSFIPPGQNRLRGQIQEGLDLPLIQQEAENDALDIGKVARFIIDMMGRLCAPCRDEDVKPLREITDIVPLFRSIFSVLDKMKIDSTNFAVSSLRTHLLQQSGEYERTKFQEIMDKQPNALDFTKKWLQDAADDVTAGETEEGATCTANPAQVPVNVHNHAYLRLLKWDHDADAFPETLVLDQSRFLKLQQELEQLALVASLLLIVYNGAGEAISGLPGLMERLKQTIRILLAEMHSSSFNADETFAAIGETLCSELRGCLSQHGFTPFSPDKESFLKGQVVAAKSKDNSVRKVIDARIQSFLVAFLENRSVPALPGGLTPISKELEEIAVTLERLVTFNKQVYSPFYQKILKDILKHRGNADV